MNFNFKHEWIETNIGLMAVLTMLAISVGGLVEIAPLFFIDKTIEKVEGVRPYTPLEQRGRDIYQREGCYTCHSQMIRPFRDEKLVTAITRWRRNRNTTTPSSGAPSAPVRIWRGWGASIPTSGTCSIWSRRVRWCPSR